MACYDARKGAGSAPLYRLSAHDRPACALTFCTAVPGLLATASTDKQVHLISFHSIPYSLGCGASCDSSDILAFENTGVSALPLSVVYEQRKSDLDELIQASGNHIVYSCSFAGQPLCANPSAPCDNHHGSLRGACMELAMYSAQVEVCRHKVQGCWIDQEDS